MSTAHLAPKTLSPRVAGSGCLLFCLAPLLVLLMRGAWLSRLGQWLRRPAQLAPADAIVVLGGGFPRLEYAADLFRQGLAPELWATGGSKSLVVAPHTYGELEREYFLSHGVPADKLRILATTSTWEDGRAVAELASRQGTGSILLVTEWYHGRRALAVMRRALAGQDVQIYYAETPPGQYGPDNWWRHEVGLTQVAVELLKIALYWRQYELSPFAR